jgi:hypothetical protein
MGKSKETFMELYESFEERYYILIQKIKEDKELLYEQLDCDIRPKDIE